MFLKLSFAIYFVTFVWPSSRLTDPHKQLPQGGSHTLQNRKGAMKRNKLWQCHSSRSRHSKNARCIWHHRCHLKVRRGVEFRERFLFQVTQKGPRIYFTPYLFSPYANFIPSLMFILLYFTWKIENPLFSCFIFQENWAPSVGFAQNTTTKSQHNITTQQSTH